MKELFYNILLLFILSFAMSGLSSCSGSANSLSGPAQQSPGLTNDVLDQSAPGKSDYPPIATAVAQAEIKNLDGTTFKIADRKGKVILLNMWATWCGPCRQEMPALVRMQDTYRDEGFEVIGLNTDDETVEAINKFAESMGLNYQLVWADTSLQRELLKISQFGGIPQSFIIDRDGNLRAVFKGANPRDIKQMEELVGKVVRGENAAPTNIPTAESNTTIDTVGNVNTSFDVDKKSAPEK